MSSTLIIILSLVGGLLIYLAAHFWQQRIQSRNTEQHFSKIAHSILEDALLARAVFLLEPDARAAGNHGYRGELDSIHDGKLTLRLLDPMSSLLEKAPVCLQFQTRERSGQQYFKFNAEILKILAGDPQKLELSFPVSLEIGHKRNFVRVTPPADSIRLLSVWSITPEQPMPLSLAQVGQPLLATRRDDAAPPLFLANISASGMAIGFPASDEYAPLPVDLKRGSPLFCLLVFEMEGKPVTFWSTCSVNNVRWSKRDSAHLVGLEYTNWAVLQPGERSLEWLHASPAKGVPPILRWVESLGGRQ
ncbi:hypothetical protein [uncultured Desulfovibrio sp.]|uniref:PilZ domain-containing protein n=1 Tax=Candidatus Desulfovibrio intestinavium TaxID=2838534 RepID=A0A9D2HNH8_9BACT|nr:hypothetical protein [uncultured Desulfovibrio sp.]HJA78693.1 hypothetical protein [Candidatus Desulfovibrio intestinavium]